MLYAFHALKLRGTITPDPMHRITNNVKLADNLAHLNVLKLEYATVLSLRVGPFGKQQHHEVIKKATTEFFREVDDSNPVFVYLYDRICVETGWRSEPGYGNRDHYKTVWDRLERLMSSAPSGGVKLSRWFSFEHRLDALMAHGGPTALLMILLYIGFRRGWWKKAGDRPLARSGQFQVQVCLVTERAIS